MAKLLATLVDGKSYCLVPKVFENGVAVAVTEKEAAILRKQIRTFQDPQTRTEHQISRFKIDEVKDEANAEVASPEGEGTAPPRTR